MTDPSSKPPPPQPSIVIGTLFLALVFAELIAIYTNFSLANYCTIALVLSIPLAGRSQLKMRETYLLSVCTALGLAALWVAENPAQATNWISEGAGRSAYLGSFILLMALLREGALTSNSVLQIGKFLTQQPPNRRFLAVFSGGHMLSVMINLGSLSLLAPIIQRGVRANLVEGAPLDEISQIRERRQLSAALRGFSWFLVWAPTAVTQAVMPTLMSGIDALRLVGLGLALAGLMLVVSWIEDWIRWRGFTKARTASGQRTKLEIPKFPVKALRNFALVCAALFAVSLFASRSFDVSIVSGVMLASPIVVAVWTFVQLRQGNQFRDTRNRLNKIAFTAMPNYFREAVFVACAGFIGTVGAKMVPVAELTQTVGLENIPGWLILWSLTVTVWCFGQIGLSPITMAVFLGSIVAEIPVMPVDMTHAALAIAAGTAVCSTGAPFSAGALMLSRATGYSSMTLTWRWNGPYTLLAIAVLAVVYRGLEGS